MAGCTATDIKIEGTKASATGSVAVQPVNIASYPKPPVRDDGILLLFSTLFGTILGKYANKSKISKAYDSENRAKDIIDQANAWANSTLSDSKAERARAEGYYGKLFALNAISEARSIREAFFANDLKNDIKLNEKKIKDKLNEYENIDLDKELDFVKLQVEQQIKKQNQQFKYNKYKVGQCCDYNYNIIMAGTSAYLSGATRIYNNNYNKKIEMTKLRIDYNNLLESKRNNRINNVNNAHNQVINSVQNTAQNWLNDAYKREVNALDLLSAVSKTLLTLANSYRETAKHDMSSIQTILLPLITLLIPRILSYLKSKDTCENEKGSSGGGGILGGLLGG